MSTILIIEYNRNIRENTVEFLEMEGYRIITATDGKDGFQKVAHFIPDLIVCDVLMPKMGGLELLACQIGNEQRPKNNTVDLL